MRGLQTATNTDLKAVLAEKIPAEQVSLLTTVPICHPTRCNAAPAPALTCMQARYPNTKSPKRQGTAGRVAAAERILSRLASETTVTPLLGLPYMFTPWQERLKGLKKAHGSMELGKTTLDMVIGGMRGITVRRSCPHRRILCLTSTAHVLHI